MSSDEPQFAPANPVNYTLNVQNAIKRHALSDKLRQDQQKIVLKSDPNYLDNDDLLVTNNLDASFTNENSVGTLPNNRKSTRYNQRTSIYLNISSRQRDKYTSRPVIPDDRDNFPNKEIWDEFFNPETGEFSGDLDICCITFNNLLEFGQEFPFFFQKENQLWVQVPNDLDTNEYSIILRPAINNVRLVRLVSVESPQLLDVVNEQNNLLMLDVIDPCTGESFPHTPDTDLPFSLLLIPIGDYTVQGLMQKITDMLNETISPFLKESGRSCTPFTYFYDPSSGQIDILSEYLFHLRFWFSTTYPQFHLWEMLGYQYPYPRDEDNEPAYVNNFTNLVEKESPLIDTGQVNKVPFSRPNLDVYDYYYLAISGLGTIQDPQIIREDLFAKIFTRDSNRNFGTTVKVFETPLDSLERIRVRWIDPFGNLLNLNGQENSFLLEIVNLQDRLKDADFSTKRGLQNYDEEVPLVQHVQTVSIT